MRVRVAGGPPPGTNTALGAITGAIIGAAVGGPRSGPAPALFGAVAGAAIGSATDAQNAQQSREVEVTDRRAYMAMQQQAYDYRRAITACLQARGYSVR
jgi:outer membrane lipoprotein SlyB